MFTRVGGATLALVAAVSLALSIAGAMGPLPGWWSGHPNVQGTLLKSKHVDIGLLETRGCNTGGDKTCQPVGVTGTVATTGYVAAGVAGLLALASVLLAILAAAQSERRRSIAKLAVFAVVVAGIVAIALILQGPGIEAKTADNQLLNVIVPLGLGTYLFAAGVVSAILASVLALRPTPRVRPKVPRAVARQVGPGAAAATSAQPLDVHALLQNDALRPAALGPEPTMGRPTPNPPGVSPAPPHPAGAQPLFSAAPQLRPLYEAAPGLGGTGGFIPSQPPPRVMRPPTPIAREQISSIAGIPTPPAFDAAPDLPRSGPLAFATTSPDLGPRDPMELPSLQDTPAAFAPPPRPHPPSRPPELASTVMSAVTEPPGRRVATALGAAPSAPPPLPSASWVSPPAPGPSWVSPASPPPPPAGEPRPKTLPPPLRNKSVSAPPPLSISARPQPPPPAAVAPPARPPGAVAPPARPPGPAVPVVSPPRIGASGPVPRPVANPGSGGARPAPATRPPPDALGGPTPVTGSPFAPMVPFPAPSAMASLGPRPPTDPLDRASTLSFAAETQDLERQEDSAMARLRSEGDATGVIEAPPDFESATGEGRAFGRRSVTDADDISETNSVAKVNPTDLDLPLVKPPPARAAAEDDDSGSAAPSAAAAAARPESPKAIPDRLARGLRAFGFKPPEAAERPETSPLVPPPAPASPAASASSTGASAVVPKVPISTAPSSLPPPSEKQSAISGPSPACPQCEAPMAWVEEHLRFYCKSCKMYF